MEVRAAASLAGGVGCEAAGVSVPLALAGTCAGMWLAGFSIDNLSLMALAISVGFVVDDVDGTLLAGARAAGAGRVARAPTPAGAGTALPARPLPRRSATSPSPSSCGAVTPRRRPRAFPARATW